MRHVTTALTTLPSAHDVLTHILRQEVASVSP